MKTSEKSEVQTDTRSEQKIVGAVWLKTYTVHEVPARQLTRDEYIEYRQKILEAEKALGQPIYQVRYEGDA